MQPSFLILNSDRSALPKFRDAVVRRRMRRFVFCVLL
ncbi:hypothetical a-type peptide pheromone precursor, partial [Postia placenta Mad-698-R]